MMEMRGNMGTKSRKSKLLQVLTKVAVGAITLAFMRTVPAMAADMDHVVRLNVGAAEVLEGFEEIATETSVHEIMQQEEKAEEDSEEADLKSGLVMADVKNSLNVRAEASEEAEKVGFLYADCGGEILETTEGWTKIKSGNLVGWASNEYLLFGEEAEELAESVGRSIATVNTDALRVRKEPNQDSGVWGLVKRNDKIEAVIEESTDDWVAIEFEGELGFISGEYVTTEFLVDHGETFEEIKERERKEQEEKAKLIANLGAVAVGTTDDVLLGALVQCEAGNQSYEGKLAVAAVVMNRVRSGAYPNTIGGVIYASGQFTPAGNGKVQQRLELGVDPSCLQAAQEAIAGKTNVGTATHFKRVGKHDGYVLGDHVFW